MSRSIILDTGVLIAFLMPKDKFHTWAVSQFSQITVPVITNEAVITEACFLAQRIHHGLNSMVMIEQSSRPNLNLDVKVYTSR
jgi:predicted nucleic acid-binding protein